MARYSISFTRPGEGPAIHVLEAKSDAEARLRFMNLSWVAFTAISINSIALKGDQPEAAKKATSKKPGKVGATYTAIAQRSESVPPRRAEQREPRTISREATKAAADRAEARADGRSGRALGKQPRSHAYVRAASPKGQEASIRAAAAGIVAPDWQAEIERLTDEIGDLADKAQALTRAGDYDAADALRAKAKQLAATRAEITKRNKTK